MLRFSNFAELSPSFTYTPSWNGHRSELAIGIHYLTSVNLRVRLREEAKRMSSAVCHTCGIAIRGEVAAGLCPRCLLVRALEFESNRSPEILSKPQEQLRSIGSFDLLDEIGRGGMGVVFRARERGLERVVALKLLQGGEWASTDFLYRFRTEARAAASLVHPHIVRVYAFGEDRGNWYIAMQWIDGAPLDSMIRIQAGSPLSENTLQGRETDHHREIAMALKKLSEAVHYAHQHGVLHRDLKPANVLIDLAGEPFLTDFGLACLLESDDRRTHSSSSLGTPAYVAPEVAREGAQRATVASDVYGLGAILYEWLTGQPPFGGATPLEVLRRVADTEAPPPSSLRHWVNRDLETICVKAIAKEPDKRYASCAALAEDLDRWLQGIPIEARPVGTMERAGKWMRRRPMLSALVGLLILSWLIITIGSWQVSKHLGVRAEEQRRSLVRLNVETANRAMTQNDAVSSLSAQIGVLKLEASDPERQITHRRRLNLTLHDLPGLTFVWKHLGAVTMAAFSRDGERVVSSGDDATARIWNVRDGRAGAVMKHPATVATVAFSPDGHRVLTVCSDGGARIWNAETGIQESRTWPVVVSYYAMVMAPMAAFNRDGSRVLITTPTGVEIRDTASGELAMPGLESGSGWVHSEFSHDDQHVVATHRGGLVSVSDVSGDNPKHKGTYQHSGEAFYAHFSPSDRRVVSVGAEASGIIWDPLTGAVLAPPLEHDSKLRIGTVAFGPTDSQLLTLSFDNSIRIWDGSTGGRVTASVRQPRGVMTGKWDAAGERVVTSSFDGNARLWDARTGESVGVWLPHPRYVVDASFSPAGDQVVTACLDGGVRLWKLAPSTFASSSPNTPAVRAAFQSRSGAWTGVARSDGVVRMMGATSTETSTFELPHTSAVVRGVYDSSEHLLATVTEQGDLRVWDLSQRRPLGTARKTDLEVLGLSFDTKGSRIVAVGESRSSRGHQSLKIWETAGGEPFEIRLSEPINNAEFDPDGSRVLTTSLSGVVRTYDVKTGIPSGVPLELAVSIAPAHFSPDGKTLVTCSAPEGFVPGEARIWTADLRGSTGKPMRHEDGVLLATFTRDSKRLATGSEDSTARIWDVSSGLPLTSPMPHSTTITFLMFTQDGSILAVGTRAGQVRLWDASSGDPLMASRSIPGGIASMAFVESRSELLVVDRKGEFHRWNFAPASQSIEDLTELENGLKGGGRLVR